MAPTSSLDAKHVVWNVSLRHIYGSPIQVLVAASYSWAPHIYVTFIKKFCCNYKRCIWIIPDSQ